MGKNCLRKLGRNCSILNHVISSSLLDTSFCGAREHMREGRLNHNLHVYFHLYNNKDLQPHHTVSPSLLVTIPRKGTTGYTFLLHLTHAILPCNVMNTTLEPRPSASLRHRITQLVSVGPAQVTEQQQFQAWEYSCTSRCLVTN